MSPTGILLHVASLRGLPVPVALFVYATANVVVLSFVPAALFAGERQSAGAPALRRLPAPWPPALTRLPAARAAGALAGLAVVVACVGSTWGWLCVVAGLALVGDVWPAIDPWAAAHDLLGRGRPRRPRLALPERLGTWPAVAAGAGVAAVGLVAAPSHRPDVAAVLVAGYSALTLAGMALLGRDVWLARCDGVSVLLGLAGRFGPGSAACDPDGVPRVGLRPWGARLLDRQRPGWDRVALVIVLLSALALAGLLDTAPWRAFTGALGGIPAASALAGVLAMVLLAATGLAVFAAFARLMLALAGAPAGDAAAITGFALTLVPIALLYAVALAAGILLVQAQSVLPAWALARPDAVWYLQGTLVVIGHAIAVHLAHRHAGAHFRSARRALLAEYPMVVMLVVWTMAAMWILTQPLV